MLFYCPHTDNAWLQQNWRNKLILNLAHHDKFRYLTSILILDEVILQISWNRWYAIVHDRESGLHTSFWNPNRYQTEQDVNLEVHVMNVPKPLIEEPYGFKICRGIFLLFFFLPIYIDFFFFYWTTCICLSKSFQSSGQTIILVAWISKNQK